jgi:hypothetical protein
MKIKIPILKLPKLKLPLDFDDLLLIAGTITFTIGLWGYDYRKALMVLGAWLIFLARPKRGA